MADTDTQAPPQEDEVTTTDTQDGAGNEQTQPQEDSKPEGDQESKALAAVRREAAGYRTKLRATEKELEKLREAQLTEQEKAMKAAREEGYAEGRSKGDQRLIRAEVIAAAAGKAADPNDVYALLSVNGALNGVDVNDDGEVDSDAIAKVVDALLEEKKHLAAQPAQPTRDPDFGARTPAAPALNSDAAMDAFIRGAAGRR